MSRPAVHYAVRLAGVLEPLCRRRRGRALTRTEDALLVTCGACQRALVTAWGRELAA